MTLNDLLSQQAFVLITGASKGYGQVVAACIAPHLQPDSILILTARNLDGLKKTKAQVSALKLESVQVKCVVSDLSNDDDVKNFMNRCASEAGDQLLKCKTALLIHNAGSLGDVTLKIDQYQDLEPMTKYFNFNVTNVLYLTTQFLALSSQTPALSCIVNVSSLCAIEPFVSCGLYCTGKAAREMMFQVLAAERPDVRILNWSPGPMETDMGSDFRNTCNEDLAQLLQKMLRDNTYVSCESSAEKLIMLLKKNDFTSGKHIDVSDVHSVD